MGFFSGLKFLLIFEEKFKIGKDLWANLGWDFFGNLPGFLVENFLGQILRISRYFFRLLDPLGKKRNLFLRGRGKGRFFPRWKFLINFFDRNFLKVNRFEKFKKFEKNFNFKKKFFGQNFPLFSHFFGQIFFPLFSHFFRFFFHFFFLINFLKISQNFLIINCLYFPVVSGSKFSWIYLYQFLGPLIMPW